MRNGWPLLQSAAGLAEVMTGVLIGGTAETIFIAMGVAMITITPVRRFFHGRYREDRSSPAHLRAGACQRPGAGAGSCSSAGGPGPCTCLISLRPGAYAGGGLVIQGRQAGKSQLLQAVSAMQARYGGFALTQWQAAALAAFDSFCSGQPGFTLCYEDGSAGPVPHPETGDSPGPGSATIKSGLAVSGPMRIRLYTGPPAAPPPGSVVSGAGYTSGGKTVAKQPQQPGKPQPAPGAQGLFQVVPSQPKGGSLYNRGMAGFDGFEIQPAGDLVVPDVFGTVRGYRWWSMSAPPLHESPAHADRVWPSRVLQGTRDLWLPGENVAKCLANGAHDPSLIPLENCGCGFWAYWRLQSHDIGAGSLPVCGVVEGYGAVLIGEKGFRAAKARIVALHLPFTIMPADYVPHDPEREYGSHNPWWNHPKFTGKVHHIGYPAPLGSQVPPQPPPVPELDAASAEERAGAAQARADAAEAWMAVIGDRLATLYPDAQVFETRQAMEKTFPPDLSYIPDRQVRCAGCDLTFPAKSDHFVKCVPQRR